MHLFRTSTENLEQTMQVMMSGWGCSVRDVHVHARKYCIMAGGGTVLCGVCKIKARQKTCISTCTCTQCLHVHVHA